MKSRIELIDSTFRVAYSKVTFVLGYIRLNYSDVAVNIIFLHLYQF